MRNYQKPEYIIFFLMSFFISVFSLKLVIYGKDFVRSALVFILPLVLEIVEIWLQNQNENGYHYDSEFDWKLKRILLILNGTIFAISIIVSCLLYVVYEMNIEIKDTITMCFIVLLWVYPLKFLIELLLCTIRYVWGEINKGRE